MSGHRRVLSVVIAIAAALGTCSAWAESSSLELPKELAWCDPLPVVAEKLEITDTSEAGHAYRADGVYLVTGKLWGHDGTYTAHLEQFGEEFYLFELEFRMFRLDSAWEDIVAGLSRALGPGSSEVVAEAAYGPNGETIVGQRSKHVYRDADAGWEVVAHQMSNEIDLVKWTHSAERCRPAPVETDEPDETTTTKRRDLDVFDYDPYADDPLHSDTRAKELEEERKRKAEEAKQKEEQTEVDWTEEGGTGEDVDVDWDDGDEM